MRNHEYNGGRVTVEVEKKSERHSKWRDVVGRRTRRRSLITIIMLLSRTPYDSGVTAGAVRRVT